MNSSSDGVSVEEYYFDLSPSNNFKSETRLLAGTDFSFNKTTHTNHQLGNNMFIDHSLSNDQILTLIILTYHIGSKS